MSEEKINTNFQNKALIFFKKNRKLLILLSITLIFVFFSFIFYNSFQEKKDLKTSEEYNQASILLDNKKKVESKLLLESIINKNNKFYSPLALYLIIDNDLEKNPLKIISSFDKILKIKSIDEENINLIKIKKAIFLFNNGNEELVVSTLNSVINSNSVWRVVAIKLIIDYFLSKDQNSKADEYTQLLNVNINK